MGASKASDLLATIGAIEVALKKSGVKFAAGLGLEAAQEVLLG